MTWIQAIQDMLPRPERRSDDEIENDLEAEIAFHLEQSTRDLMSERGLAREDASDIARGRFGSVESIKKRCKRIALEERIMLKRIHAVLTLLLALGMVVTIMIAVRAVARERDMAVRERMVAEMARQDADNARKQVGGTIERARADALYDFVMTLMNEVGVERAGDHAHIRKVLDKMEAELPKKYPNNSDLQGLIAEMIAGRRKILEYDERPAGIANLDSAMVAERQRVLDLQQRSDTAEQKVAALQRFVNDILAKADPNAPPPVTVNEFLELAKKQMGADVGIAPDSRELLQKVLDDAVKNLKAAQTQPATQPSSE